MTIRSKSLKEIERRAYRSTFADGIYDIQFGLFFLTFALIAIMESYSVSHYIGYVLLLIPLIFPWLGKRYITIPRMGEVELGERRKKRRLIILSVAVIVLILTLPLLIMIVKQSQSGVLGWKLIAIFAAPILVLVVYTTEFPRLYVYAGLLIFGSIESELLLGQIGSPLNAVLSYGFPGIVITTIGIGLLLKFIKTHPHVEMDYAD